MDIYDFMIIFCTQSNTHWHVFEVSCLSLTCVAYKHWSSGKTPDYCFIVHCEGSTCHTWRTRGDLLQIDQGIVLARWFVGMLKPKEHGEDDRIVSQDCMLDTKGKLTRLTIRQSENEWQGSTRALRKSSLDVSTCFKPKRSPQYNLACIFFTFYILAAIWMWEEFHNIRKRLRKEQLSPCGSLAIDARCSLTRVGVETCGADGRCPTIGVWL